VEFYKTNKLGGQCVFSKFQLEFSTSLVHPGVKRFITKKNEKKKIFFISPLNEFLRSFTQHMQGRYSTSFPKIETMNGESLNLTSLEFSSKSLKSDLLHNKISKNSALCDTFKRI